ncbi:hypothetical protein [Iodobacter fluviatilis]|uniref:Uncharacterized protein n=1 Tax=Iodobacter fluviatilis TaxID=537 RepID=A0A377Q7Z3_9NEIS|nr:hypothetical protein [Iodobacter fluviatilis]TCU88555.1 hypothetical protein EV682_103139 [Iodobacter fluviatilis]STQ91374.1 Uncharacterised protein [Iodobacter fluviatilis]
MQQGVKIEGNVGVAVNAEPGAAIHFHLSQSNPTQNAALNHAVSKLMKICTEGQCKEEIEKISQTLYGISLFKSLQPEQIATLQKIAEVIQTRTMRDSEKQEKTNALLATKELAASLATQQLTQKQTDLEQQTLRANSAVEKMNQPCMSCAEHASSKRLVAAAILLIIMGMMLWYR